MTGEAEFESSVVSKKSKSSVVVLDKCSFELGVSVPIPTLEVDASAVKYTSPLLFLITKSMLLPPLLILTL